jgi:hypothetical protein
MAYPMRIRHFNKAMRAWLRLKCLSLPVSFNIKMLAIIVMISVTMTSYKTLGDTLANEARPFSRAELYAYISEKTQVWSEGRVFHSEAGTLLLLWKGQYGKGTWSTDDNGVLCWHVWSWNEVPCQAFYHNNDGVSIVFKGATSSAPELEEGNTLVNLELGVESSAKFVLGLSENFTDTLLAKEETIDLLSGKTVIWGLGRGLYYSPDFKLMKIWNGVRGTGTWSVSDEGAVCWHVPGWGETPCEVYYYNGDELMVILEGTHSKASKHINGNTIGSF